MERALLPGLRDDSGKPRARGGADIPVCLESVSGGRSCPPEPIQHTPRVDSNPLGGAGMPRTRGFGQTGMSAPPNPAEINVYASPKIRARPDPPSTSAP